jgi:hypothetical protein
MRSGFYVHVIMGSGFYVNVIMGSGNTGDTGDVYGVHRGTTVAWDRDFMSMSSWDRADSSHGVT